MDIVDSKPWDTAVAVVVAAEVAVAAFDAEQDLVAMQGLPHTGAVAGQEFEG